MTTFAHLAYFVFLLAIILFTVFGDSGLYKLHTLKQSKGELARSIKRTEQRIESLETEKRRLVNADYLESVVRSELGYIKDGEVVYQIMK